MSNNDTRKPREFWIDPTDDNYHQTVFEYTEKPPMNDMVHVIEYSAYEDLRKIYLEQCKDTEDVCIDSMTLRKERDEAMADKAMLYEKVLELKKERDEYREALENLKLRRFDEVLAKYPKENK